jgi:hypothetical protein
MQCKWAPGYLATPLRFIIAGALTSLHVIAQKPAVTLPQEPSTRSTAKGGTRRALIWKAQAAEPLP